MTMPNPPKMPKRVAGFKTVLSCLVLSGHKVGSWLSHVIGRILDLLSVMCGGCRCEASSFPWRRIFDDRYALSSRRSRCASAIARSAGSDAACGCQWCDICGRLPLINGDGKRKWRRRFGEWGCRLVWLTGCTLGGPIGSSRGKRLNRWRIGSNRKAIEMLAIGEIGLDFAAQMPDVGSPDRTLPGTGGYRLAAQSASDSA